MIDDEQIVKDIKDKIGLLVERRDKRLLIDLQEHFKQTQSYVGIRRFNTLEDVWWYLEGVNWAIMRRNEEK